MSTNLIPVDRSRTVSDWVCKRRRYLNYELYGRGIVSTNEPLALVMGTIIHTALAEIALATMAMGDVDIDIIAYKAQQDMFAHLSKDVNVEEGLTFAKEQAALVEGLIRGFHRHVWPRMLNQYPKIIAVEQEMPYTYGRLLFMAKPDLVAVDTNGEVVLPEYKSTSSKQDSWINSWATAVQLHSTTRAIEAALGEKISRVVVQGLFKGFLSYSKQNSPFCYAYRKNGQPPFSADQIAYEYKAGLKRFPTWELDGGVKAWVEGMPEDLLANQFPATPPIFVNDDLVESFFAQRNTRETAIHTAMEQLEGETNEPTRTAILNAVFPQTFAECSPAWGTGCPYRRICFGEVTKPLEQGFVLRISHHAPEAAAWAAEDSAKGIK